MNDRSSLCAAVLVAAAFFVATAPTLSWLEFSSSMENLNVATALEIRREDRWLLPTLEGEPRIAKPPLAAWVAAASIRPSTFAHLDDADPAVRDAAYRSLAWDVRWTALLCSCLTLLAVFDLGRTIGRAPVGLIAMIVCGSTLYLLRFGRQATTDVQLALWVTLANAAIARLILRGPSWRAAFVASIALGLALMSKGPVALLETLAPACVFALWRRRARISTAQVAVLLLLTITLGGGWYTYVYLRVPHVGERWKIELARSGLGEHAGNLLSYATILLYMLPWTAVFLHGVIWSGVEAWRARRRDMRMPDEAEGMILALLLVLVPIVVMSFFPDRKERYLLPLAGPAAVLAARGIGAMLDPAARRRTPPWVQWATIAVIAVGLPIAGVFLKRVGGAPWYPPAFAACAGVVLVMLLIILIQQSRRHAFLLVVGPAAIMLLLQPLLLIGYRDTREGRSEMRPLAETIRQVAPTAQIYNWRPEAPKRADVSLAIYTNRAAIWVPDPSHVPPSDRPQVMITQQRQGAAAPAPPPEWIFLQSIPHDKDRYLAFVRPPAAPAAPTAQSSPHFAPSTQPH